MSGDKYIGVKSTSPFKLKNKPGRNAVRVNLLDTFGFVPEDIIIHKASLSSSRIVLSAVLTPKEEKKRDRLMKEKESKEKAGR